MPSRLDLGYDAGERVVYYIPLLSDDCVRGELWALMPTGPWDKLEWDNGRNRSRGSSSWRHPFVQEVGPASSQES